MRRDGLRAGLRSLLISMPFLLNACARPADIPPWFDAILRMPVKTVLVQGHRIVYTDVGDGPPVILVHGFGGSLWQWEYQQQALSTHFRLITLDLLGSGFSDKPEISYTPTALVEFFRDFMDALALPRASLAGNSMGAGLVIGMALDAAERVEKVVLISGLPDHVREKLTSPLLKRALAWRAPVWLANLGNWFTGQSTTRAVLEEMVYDHGMLTPVVIERSYQNRRRRGLMAPLLSLSGNLSLWEDGFAKRIGEIRRPTLIIWGVEDEVFPLQVGRDLQTQLPGASLELIPRAGHIPMWERPDLVNPLLIRFLSN